jgi:hypothetical protein
MSERLPDARREPVSEGTRIRGWCDVPWTRHSAESQNEEPDELENYEKDCRLGSKSTLISSLLMPLIAHLPTLDRKPRRQATCPTYPNDSQETLSNMSSAESKPKFLIFVIGLFVHS